MLFRKNRPVRPNADMSDLVLFNHRYEQGNHNYTSPALCTLVTPFPAIGDATCRQRAGGRRSHGHRQHAQKFGKDRAFGSGGILPDKHTHIQTDRHRHTHHNTSQPLPRAK